MTILSVFFEVVSPKHTRACSSLKRWRRSLQTAWHAVCRLHGAVCRLREVSRLHGTSSTVPVHVFCIFYYNNYIAQSKTLSHVILLFGMRRTCLDSFCKLLVPLPVFHYFTLAYHACLCMGMAYAKRIHLLLLALQHSQWPPAGIDLEIPHLFVPC